MRNTLERKTGISLTVFITLLLFTMVLHPAGGSVEHMIKITRIIVITHAIAIFSLPFGWMGFWGLTRKIGMEHFGSTLALVIASFGLVAIMLAGATNGLVLPLFLQLYKDATPQNISSIKPILQYGYAVNQAFDYIYTGAFCFAIHCWSVLILFTKKLATWIGWVGIAASLAIAAVFLSGVAVNSLLGFRFFSTVIITWIFIVGVKLYNQK